MKGYRLKKSAPSRSQASTVRSSPTSLRSTSSTMSTLTSIPSRSMSSGPGRSLDIQTASSSRQISTVSSRRMVSAPPTAVRRSFATSPSTMTAFPSTSTFHNTKMRRAPSSIQTSSKRYASEQPTSTAAAEDVLRQTIPEPRAAPNEANIMNPIAGKHGQVSVTELKTPTDQAIIEPHSLKILEEGLAADMSALKLTPSAPPIPMVTDETLEQFIPPQPSRIIPVIHDGMDWDEPNFLIRPFVTVIDYLHDLTSWPWYISIITWAWVLRSAISPLTYKQQSSAVKFTLLQPDLLNINKELRTMPPGTPQYKEKQKEVVELYRKHGVSPFTSVFWSLSSMPFYVCSFLAIRNMANSPFFASEFATGGFFPYLNLSAAAGWELATLNAVVNLTMMHVTQPVPFHKMQKLQKIMFMMSHAMIIGFIPILSNINTASIFYFVANNSFSIMFQKFFYTDWFRKKVNLPTVAEVNAIRELIQKKAADPLGNKDPIPDGANKRAFVLGQDDKVSSQDIIQQAKEQLHRASGGLISQPSPVPENLKNVNAFTIDSTLNDQQKQKSNIESVFGKDPTAPKPLPPTAPRSPRKSKRYVRH